MTIQTLVALASGAGVIVFATLGYVLRGMVSPDTPRQNRHKDDSDPVRNALINAESLLLRERAVRAKVEQRITAQASEIESLRDRLEKATLQLDQQPTTVSAAPQARMYKHYERQIQTLNAQLTTELEAKQQLSAQLNALATQKHASTTASAMAQQRELDQLRQTIKSGQIKAQQALAAQQTAEQEAIAARNEMANYKKQLRDAEQTINALRIENTQLREDVQALHRENTKSSAATSSLEHAQAEIRDLQLKLHAAIGKADFVDAMRDELAQARKQLANAQPTAPPDVMKIKLEQQHRELVAESDLLKRRLSQMKHYAEDNASLKQQLHALQTGKETEQALKRRIHELEAQLSAQTKSAAQIETRADASDAIHAQQDTVGGTIDAIIGQFATRTGCKAAVLADAQGLLLGSWGQKDLFEALAGVSGSVHGLTDTMRDFLPIGEATVVDIVDGNNVGLSTRLFRIESESFALSSFGVTHTRNDTAVERIVDALTSIFTG